MLSGSNISQTDLLVAPKTTALMRNDVDFDSNTHQYNFDSASYSTKLSANFMDNPCQIRYGDASNGTSSSGGIANLLNTVTTPQG